MLIGIAEFSNIVNQLNKSNIDANYPNWKFKRFSTSKNLGRILLIKISDNFKIFCLNHNN